MQNTKKNSAGKKKAGNGKLSKNQKRKAVRRVEREAIRTGIVGGQNSVRGDVGLSLTRSQFTASTPLTLWETKRASTPGGIRVRGREFAGMLVVPDETGAAFKYVGWNATGVQPRYLNPYQFPRLASLADIYEEYYFHSCRYTFLSGRATNTNGTLYLWADYDCADTPPDIAAQAMSNVSSTMANIYSDQSMVTLGSLSRLKRYFCSSDDDADSDSAQVLQAEIFAAVSGNGGLIPGDALGNVIVEYDVEFFTPCLEQVSDDLSLATSRGLTSREKFAKRVLSMQARRQLQKENINLQKEQQKEKFNAIKKAEKQKLEQREDILEQLRRVVEPHATATGGYTSLRDLQGGRPEKTRSE